MKRQLYALVLLSCLMAPALSQDTADVSAPDAAAEEAPREEVGDPEVEEAAPEEESMGYEEVLSLNQQGLNTEVQLYNLALVDAQRGRAPLAVARLRQSLYLNPTFKEAQRALEWALEENSIPTAETRLETLRSWLWLYQPAWVYPLGTLLTLFVGVWLLLGWVERYRQNQAQDLDRPPLHWSMVTLLSLALLLGTIWAHRAWDRSFVERATYLGQSGFKVSPSDDAPEVAPLRAGSEVIVERAHGEWVLARLPGGAAGWVPKDTLYKTTAEPTPEDLANH